MRVINPKLIDAIFFFRENIEYWIYSSERDTIWCFFLFLYRYEIFDIIRPRRYHGNFKVYRLLIEYEFYPVTDIDFYEKKKKKRYMEGYTIF